jgi:hypothetical protein
MGDFAQIRNFSGSTGGSKNRALRRISMRLTATQIKQKSLAMQEG